MTVNGQDRSEEMMKGWPIFEKKKLSAFGAIIDIDKIQVAIV